MICANNSGKRIRRDVPLLFELMTFAATLWAMRYNYVFARRYVSLQLFARLMTYTHVFIFSAVVALLRPGRRARHASAQCYHRAAQASVVTGHTILGAEPISRTLFPRRYHKPGFDIDDTFPLIIIDYAHISLPRHAARSLPPRWRY